ncbi:MAG TPA: hypothetical protein VMD07_08830 [Candidatus Acidoferrales bacterium]|nr:hypothetical protein [Candidatus Acidoferrales bacterium]
MNRSLPASIAAYVGTISVPECDVSAILTRRQVQRKRPLWNPWMSAVVAAGVAIAILANVPAVVAQVERVFRAFTVVNGHTVPLVVQRTTLAEARAHVPFTVIEPAGIPAGLHSTIREFSSESSPSETRLMIEYRKSASEMPPALTIMEISDEGQAEHNVLFMSKGPVGAPPPQIPNALAHKGAGGAVAVQDYKLKQNGQEKHWRVKLQPVSWVQHGTRVILMSPPDALSSQQLAAIRTAMQAR